MSLTPEDFLNAGYRKFQDSFRKYAEFGLQKKVTDKDGVMYFITIYCYNFENIPQSQRIWSFETDIHFDAKDGYMRLSWSVEDIKSTEAKVSNFWKFCGSPYYERW